MTKPKNQDQYTHIDHESRIIRVETVIESINQSLIRLENKIDKIDNRLWQVMFWTIAGFIGILGVLAKVFHWLQ